MHVNYGLESGCDGNDNDDDNNHDNDDDDDNAWVNATADAVDGSY